MDEEESRDPYANGTSTGTVVGRRVTFMGVGRQLGGRREERTSSAGGEKGRRRGETNGEVGDGGRDKVTGTGMVMAISED